MREPRKETGRTDWERVNEEGAGNHAPFCIVYRVFSSLEKFVFVRLDIQTVHNFHYERASHTGENPSQSCMDATKIPAEGTRTIGHDQESCRVSEQDVR